MPESVGERADASPHVTPSSWWMLFVLFALYAMNFVDRQIPSMLVGPVKADLGLTDVQMSLILGPAFSIFYGLCGFPLGWAADRFERRWVIFGGVAFLSLAAGGSGLATSFMALMLCRVGVGAGEASLTPAAYSLMSDAFPRRRLTTAMAIYQTGAMVGTASSFAIGGLVIGFAENLGSLRLPGIGLLQPWQTTLLLTGAPGILLALLVFTFPEPQRRGAAPPQSAGPRENVFRFLWSERRLMGPMMIGFSMVILLAQSLVAWAPAYISRAFGWSPSQYGPILGAVSLAGGLTMVAKGWIVDWLYARGMRDAHLRFFTWLVFAALPTSIAAFLVRDPILFLVLYGVVNVLVVQFLTYLAATVQLVTPSDLRGQVIGIFVSLFSFAGMGLGPPITAAITDGVFHDESKLGLALLVVSAVSLPLAFLSLRVALRHVSQALDRREAANSHPA